jgi:hypothetical protein
MAVRGIEIDGVLVLYSRGLNGTPFRYAIASNRGTQNFSKSL